MKLKRMSVVSLVAMAIGELALAQGSIEAAPRVKFAIEAQPLSGALMTLAKQAHVQILSRDEEVLTSAHNVPAIHGEMSPQEALDRLLENTGLRYEFINPNTVRIAPRDLTEDIIRLGDGTAWTFDSARLAQLNPAGNAAEATAARGDGAVLEELVVTGTRIQRADPYEQPTPVTSITAESLQLAVPTSIADGLLQLPAFSASATRNTCCGSGTVGTFYNLRNLGTERVLVMLDGKRLVPTTEIGIIDAGLLPELLIQRVDTVTGGASSAYGSDAVSGVVNYIIDRDFTGLKTVLQGGVSGEDDNKHFKVGVAAGTDFAGGRGHVIASLEHYKSDGFHLWDRLDQAERAHFMGGNGSAATPYTSYKNARGISGTFGGLIVGGPLNGIVFDPNGGTHQFVTGQPIPGSTAIAQIGGDGFIYGNSSAMAAQRTDKFFSRASFEFTEGLTGFVRINAAESKTTQDAVANAQRGANAFTIFRDNAFLPANVAALMDTSNVTSFRLGRQSIDFGMVRNVYTGQSYDVNLGLEGKFAGTWTWSGSYSRGRSKLKGEVMNNVILDNLYAAADAVRDPATGQIVCRVTLTHPGVHPGCVPINLFGEGSPSRAALDYSVGASRQDITNTQDVVELSAQGELFQLPAGAVSAAAGVEYRKRDLLQESNPTALSRLDITGIQGFPLGICNPAIGPCRVGRFNAANFGIADAGDNVKEAFVETIVPVLRDLPGMDLLEFNGAFRFTDYANSGEVNTWKAGVNYAPIQNLRFRATRSRDIRAPNLVELFQGATVAFAGAGGILDPVFGGAPNTNTFVTRSQGNPNLKPETADAWTVGLVYQPGWLPGFSGTVDWYRIDLQDVIADGNVQLIVNSCAAGDPAACALITRTPTGEISQIVVQKFNQNKRTTTGIDFDLSYTLAAGSGQLTLRGIATRLIDLTFIEGVNRTQYAGFGSGPNVTSQPKWRASLSATYDVGPASVFVQERYLGRYRMKNFGNPAAIYAYPEVGSVLYTDLTATWKFAEDKFELYGTVNNVFDRKPPFFGNLAVVGIGYPTDFFNLYDINGRYFTLGVRMTL